MAHTVRYAFRGLPQLAADCGIFRSTFYCIAHGEVEVEFSQAEHIAQVLSKALEVPLSVPKRRYSQTRRRVLCV